MTDYEKLAREIVQPYLDENPYSELLESVGKKLIPKFAQALKQSAEDAVKAATTHTLKCEGPVTLVDTHGEDEAFLRGLEAGKKDALSRAVIRWPTQEEIERYWDLTIYIGPEEFSAARRYEFEHGLHVAQKNARIEVKE
jgi:hypothetical protein